MTPSRSHMTIRPSSARSTIGQRRAFRTCRVRHISFLLGALFFSRVDPGRAESLRLIPEPSHIVTGRGHLTLRGDITITVPGGSAEDLFAAGLLRDEIESTCSATVHIVNAAEGDIILARDTITTPTPNEGYRITATPTGVRVSSRSSVGLFWAVQTLRQMVESAGIRSAELTDSPALAWLG